ncbi:MAG: TIGR03905 family TSCPD domain-containing protein [Ruminococcaceae bacterium]|nr:TIGR03905 family TSCPD domain-containing protein [Oscillospiraceae bacterium]
MTFEYIPRGVCSRKMVLDVEDNKLVNLEVLGGCNGNLKGISSLVKGMDIDEIIERLDGITCGGKSTSCPAQLAEALKKYKNS